MTNFTIIDKAADNLIKSNRTFDLNIRDKEEVFLFGVLFANDPSKCIIRYKAIVSIVNGIYHNFSYTRSLEQTYNVYMAIASYITNKFYHVDFKQADINFDMQLWQNVVPEADYNDIDKVIDGVEVTYDMVELEHQKLLAMYISGIDSQWANQKIVDHVKEVVDCAINDL